MAFPLPCDPDFRKEVVALWLTDVEDRLTDNHLTDAELSWKTASSIYLTLPPGNGNMELEDRLFALRVKLDQTHQATNADNL